MTAWKRWQDFVTALLGVVLLITPVVLGATSNTAATRTAYLMGVLILLGGVLAGSGAMGDVGEWVPVALGAILFVTPWAVGFTGVGAMAWSAWIIGVLVVLSAGSVIFQSRRTTNRPTIST